MTTEADILGRRPAMQPIEKVEPEVDTSDWRGEHFWKVPKNPHSPRNFDVSKPKIAPKQAEAIARREKLAGLVGKGLTETDIAAQLGVSRSCIRSDLKALGLQA